MKTILILTICLGLLAGCKTTQPNNPPAGESILDYPVGKRPPVTP